MKSFLSAVKLLQDDFHRFLLLLVLAMISGGAGIGFAYGCWAGIAFMALIIFFVLSALYLRWRCRRE